MTRFLPPLVAVVIAIVSAYGIGTVWPPSAVNPDPNHAHADFAVWIGGKQLDFSDSKYMSAPPPETEGKSSSFLGIPTALAHGDEDDGHVVPGREYLHLHDGNGHVIHRHKPGLTLGDFFASIGFSVAGVALESAAGTPEARYCWYTMSDAHPFTGCESGPMRLYVNGTLYDERDATTGSVNPLGYVFRDGDRLLLTDATDPAEIRRELALLTADSCRYSKTCPWRGTPPAESCIADPTVPCTE